MSNTETKMPLRVSIVIPTLNEAAGIKECVRRAFELPVFEVIVSDGQSTDRTRELAVAAGAKLVNSPPGRGIQLNAGAAIATGDVLLFLHADCWLAPQAIGQIQTALSDLRIVGGAFRQRIEHPGRRFRWLESGNAARVRWRKIPYGDQGIFLRRSVFEEVGHFPNVRLMEDVLLMRELRRCGHRITLLPGPLHVDPRRWLKHGVIKQTLRNWTLLTALRLGVSPDRLADLYRPHTT